MKAIICGVDGAPTHIHGREPYGHDEVDTDVVDKTIKNILRVFYNDGGCAMLIVSGCENTCKHKTIGR